MKLGFFTMPMHPPGRNYTQTLKEDREAVILADRLGFSDALIGEHVTAVGHPLGRLKKWSAGFVIRADGDWFDTTIFSLPGGSGSPISRRFFGLIAAGIVWVQTW